VIFRRSLDPKPELKIYLSNAPGNIAHTRLVEMAGMRWPVECAFEEARGELGMDQYETCTWRGWHHQMTKTFLKLFALFGSQFCLFPRIVRGNGENRKI
jgi:SRSO17 transposase